MYWNLECIDSFKTRQNARTGRTTSKYLLETVAIQETRRSGNVLIKRNNY
jgi:hypothetical protein